MMMFILMSLTWFISALPFVIPYHILLCFKSKKLGFKLPYSYFLVTYIFVYYITAILGFTGIPSIKEIIHNSFGIITPQGLSIPKNEINFIPFYWISGGIRPYIENILLFVLLGFLLPCVQQEYKVIWKTVLYGFTFSLIIELSQLLNRRVTDIDDLLMNTLGAFIGWLFFRLIKKRLSGLHEKFSISIIKDEMIFLFFRKEVWFYMFCAFIGKLFVYSAFF